MISKLKDIIFHIPGWKTNRKIVVIESDDWGMIRMASRKAYNHFKNQGYLVDQCNFNSNDTLESNDDLELLFEVLKSVKDQNGNSAVITANNIVTNPDFEKIKQADFQEYHYEVFTNTLSRYPNRDRVMNLYKEGLRSQIFIPQFHGREHVNVHSWLKALQSRDEVALDSFERNMFSLRGKSPLTSCRLEFLDAYGTEGREDEYFAALVEGLDIFEKIHGFKASSFIAPCYYWSSQLEPDLAKAGICYIQGGRVQKQPIKNDPADFKKKYHFTGQRNRCGQNYLTRNASFEVSESPDKDWVDSCLSQIAFSFRFRKPAIISCHRVNFMGGIHPENRDQTLIKLKSLLEKLVKRWPEIEFMSSDQLGRVISDDQSNIRKEN